MRNLCVRMSGVCAQAKRVILVLIWTVLTGYVSTALGAGGVSSEFSTSDDGWLLVGHTSGAAPYPGHGITQIAEATVTNGFLQVQDINSNWQWVAAPAKFLGDWRSLASAQLGLMTDDAMTVYSVVLYISDSTNGTPANSARFEFPLGGTPGSSRLDLSAPLNPTDWVQMEGSWSRLITNVAQFYIRLDMNNNVEGELDQLDYVRLIGKLESDLKVYPAIAIDYYSPAGQQDRWLVSTAGSTWKFYDPTFLGTGVTQTRFFRVWDQDSVLFKLAVGGNLRIARAWEAEYFAAQGVSYQLQVSYDGQNWANAGAPQVGAGGLQSQFVRAQGPATPQMRVVTGG